LTTDHVHGGAWLVVEDGLVHVEVETDDGDVPSFTFHSLPVDFQIPSFNTGPFPGEARGLVIDRADHAWAVNGKSVLFYDDADASRLAESWQEAASPTGGADVVAADPVRGVWAAGRGELLHLDGTYRQTWPMPDALTDVPTALLVDGDGRVWMGTTENGVWTTVPSLTPAGNPLAWRTFTTDAGLESASITALAQAPDGRIYAAHQAGISILDPAGGVENGVWTTLPGSNFSERGWVNALAFGPAGDLWAGTHPEGNLKRYDGGWVDSSPTWYASIGALLVDDTGTLWAGTSRERWQCGGLRYRPAAGEGDLDWETFDSKGLVVCSVFALAQDDSGRLWIGGPEGVVMWERVE
jgi:ligand-binding sensor domain-containing protein